MSDHKMQEKTPEQLKADEIYKKAYGFKSFITLGFREDDFAVSGEIKIGSDPDCVSIEKFIHGASQFDSVLKQIALSKILKGATLKGEIKEKDKDGHTHITRFEKQL